MTNFMVDYTLYAYLSVFHAYKCDFSKNGNVKLCFNELDSDFLCYYACVTPITAYFGKHSTLSLYYFPLIIMLNATFFIELIGFIAGV